MALDKQHSMIRPHSYLSGTGYEYQTCFLCKIRKSMVCVRCGSCWLCHSAVERIESRKPAFYTSIAMLLDIESPALSEIKRWMHIFLCLCLEWRQHSGIKHMVCMIDSLPHWQLELIVISLSLASTIIDFIGEIVSFFCRWSSLQWETILNLP